MSKANSMARKAMNENRGRRQALEVHKLAQEELQAIETLSHPDVGGTTKFSDGTIAYWDETKTVYKTADGSTEMRWNRDDDTIYRAIFNSEDYGNIQEMNDNDVTEWEMVLYGNE